MEANKDTTRQLVVKQMVRDGRDSGLCYVAGRMQMKKHSRY